MKSAFNGNSKKKLKFTPTLATIETMLAHMAIKTKTNHRIVYLFEKFLDIWK